MTGLGTSSAGTRPARKRPTRAERRRMWRATRLSPVTKATMATARPSTSSARVIRSNRLTSWVTVALAASRAWALPTRPMIWPLITRATAVATTRAATVPRARPMMARRRLWASAIVAAKSSHGQDDHDHEHAR